MIDLEVLKRKSVQVEHALARIKEKLSPSADAFQEDYDSQDIVFRNFQIAVQNLMDMGNHVIAERSWQIPKTTGETFDILASHKMITPALRTNMRGLVTLRNIIVHDYTRIDHRKAFLAIQQSLKSIPHFCIALTEGGKEHG